MTGPGDTALDELHLREPSHYRAEARLRDASRVLIRAIGPDDHDAEAVFVAGMSSESRYFRFFGPKRVLSEAEVQYFTELDFIRHVGLVVTRLDTAQAPILAIGRYIAGDEAHPSRVEVAFAVEEGLHGQGLGTILLHHLAGIARVNGITEFSASVLSQNRAMLDVFSHCGFPARFSSESGVTDVVLEISDP